MRALALILVLALAGCATPRKETPPVCDGKHRRSANLYGSVLDSATPPSTTPATARPEKLSALPPKSASCA